MSQVFENHNLCKVTLLGNLVAKPEIRYLANPMLAVAEVVLATHQKWFDQTVQQYKEWTDFHTIKVIGDIVEKALRYAEKGEVMLIHGYLINSKAKNREIIHATFAQSFAKGYANSINQIQCSGTLSAPITLVQTQRDKFLAEVSIDICHQAISPTQNKASSHQLNRKIHVWGKQASYLHENAQVGDQLVVEGRLSYSKDESKSQLIDAKHSVLLKKPEQ
ncbi:single-stranded DNA-binding protein [Endozoicomonas sp. G2_1]|uniref:single-stranded DNA-binding protein n=1 Tax=Endozoicomonas sp. G2_1 TaxID=2821091 RepID=UPI001ADA576D|nr:single-stranded DNA-binding protein [Endozoicomonas sp. G2_1]MBO9489939.1 single-stranded DNA-binding protein [Endozoicomonas sp. G2_1]